MTQTRTIEVREGLCPECGRWTGIGTLDAFYTHGPGKTDLICPASCTTVATKIRTRKIKLPKRPGDK